MFSSDDTRSCLTTPSAFSPRLFKTFCAFAESGVDSIYSDSLMKYEMSSMKADLLMLFSLFDKS